VSILIDRTTECYYGTASDFPDKSKWVEFDAMWNFSKPALTSSCSDLGVGSCSDGAGAFGKGDNGEQMGQIYNSIQQIAEASLVDHRYILATILQEVSYFYYHGTINILIYVLTFVEVFWLCQCLCNYQSGPLPT
jgi:hypothetical protein